MSRAKVVSFATERMRQELRRGRAGQSRFAGAESGVRQLRNVQSLLIAGAFEPEIDELRAACEGRIVVLDGRPIRVRTAALGVGALEAALSVAPALAACAAQGEAVAECLFLGSAGVYRGEPPIAAGPDRSGCSTEFYQFDLAVLEGRARRPAPARSRVTSRAGEAAFALQAELDRTGVCERSGCNSTDSVTLVDFAPDANAGFRFENLEAYGVARALEGTGVAFTAFFALTNAVGPEGSDQWRANFRAGSLKLQRALLAVFGPVQD